MNPLGSIKRTIEHYLTSDAQDRLLVRAAQGDLYAYHELENTASDARLQWLAQPGRLYEVASDISSREVDHKALAENIMLELYATAWEALGAILTLGGMRFDGTPIRENKGRTYR